MSRSAADGASSVRKNERGEATRGTGARHWKPVGPGPDEVDLDIDPAELREFLAADLLDVQADPVFKERLRRKLWRLVRARYGGGDPEED